jgi:cation transporter-like permease
MITKADQRFIDQWREQKSGPKWKFYLLFGLAWSVVSFLVIFFLTKLFTQLWETGGANLIYILIVIAIITGFLSTHFTYTINEKKYKNIMEKGKENMN